MKTDQLALVIGIRNGLILALLLWGLLFLLWEQADCWIDPGTGICVACINDCLEGR